MEAVLIWSNTKVLSLLKMEKFLFLGVGFKSVEKESE